MWLADDQRRTCDAIIAAAIVQLADRDTRDQGAERLARLAAARDIIRRISVLYEATRSGAPGRSRTGAPRIDMEPVTRAFGAVVKAAGEPSAGGLPQVGRLAGILDRLIARRELSTPSLTRELRHAWRKLHDEDEIVVIDVFEKLRSAKHRGKCGQGKDRVEGDGSRVDLTVVGLEVPARAVTGAENQSTL